MRNTTRLFKNERYGTPLMTQNPPKIVVQPKKGFENGDIEDDGVFQVVISVGPRKPCKPEMQVQCLAQFLTRRCPQFSKENF